MNQYFTKERNLLERFSSCLFKNGKKGSGHRILLESLFFLRQNTDRHLLDFFTQKNNLILLRKTKKVSPLNALRLKPSVQGGVATLQINKFSNFLNNKLSNTTVDMQEKEDERHKTTDIVILKKSQNKSNIQNKKEKSKKKKEINFSEDSTSRKKELFSRGGPGVLFKEVEKTKSEKTMLSISPNLSICKNCVDNVKPILETRKVRKGRVTYRVPLVAHTQRQEGKAVSSLIEHAILKKKGAGQTFRKSIEITPLNYSHVQRKNLFSYPLQPKAVGNDKSLTELFQKKVQKDLLSVSSEKQMLFIASLKRLNLYSIRQTLSEQFSDAFLKKGESVEKKKQLHSLALQNRAYTHYRWW